MTGDTPVQELIETLEAMFADIAAANQKDGIPLYLCVICLDSEMYRAAGKALPLEIDVNEAFNDGDEVVTSLSRQCESLYHFSG